MVQSSARTLLCLFQWFFFVLFLSIRIHILYTFLNQLERLSSCFRIEDIVLFSPLIHLPPISQTLATYYQLLIIVFTECRRMKFGFFEVYMREMEKGSTENAQMYKPKAVRPSNHTQFRKLKKLRQNRKIIRIIKPRYCKISQEP